MKAKEHPTYQYHLTNHHKLTKLAKQLKDHHEKKKAAK